MSTSQVFAYGLSVGALLSVITLLVAALIGRSRQTPH